MCIVFCRNIKHINQLLPLFNSENKVAISVHSNMSSLERQVNIDNFKNGTYKYILVRDLFNEGIDIPATNMIVFMRCTGSRTVWLQQLGRGLRKYDGKTELNVLDFVNSIQHVTEIQNLANDIQREAQDGNAIVLQEIDINIPPANFNSPITPHINEVLMNVIIERFEDFVGVNNGLLPKIDDLEFVLPELYDNENITNANLHLQENFKSKNFVCDKIADLFPDKSFYGITKEYFPHESEKNCSKDKQEIISIATRLSKKTDELPTYDEISEASKNGNLYGYKSDEVESIVNSDILKKEFINNKIYEQKKIFDKYSDVKTLNDLRELNENQIKEIKKVFNSKIVFFNKLNGY